MTCARQAKAREKLLGVPEEDYSPSYRDHVLEIYKLFVEMADRLAQRRERANSFFLTLNTGLVALAGYVFEAPGGGLVTLLLALAGIMLCYLWYRIIRSFRGLSRAKFAVIQEIEARLPLRPYEAEWEAAGRGRERRLYLPLTHTEAVVPWVFLLLYAGLLASWLWHLPGLPGAGG